MTHETIGCLVHLRLKYLQLPETATITCVPSYCRDTTWFDLLSGFANIDRCLSVTGGADLVAQHEDLGLNARIWEQ